MEQEIEVSNPEHLRSLDVWHLRNLFTDNFGR